MIYINSTTYSFNYYYFWDLKLQITQFSSHVFPSKEKVNNLTLTLTGLLDRKNRDGIIVKLNLYKL